MSKTTQINRNILKKKLYKSLATTGRSATWKAEHPVALIAFINFLPKRRRCLSISIDH
jgi:hypothetical protein